MPRLRRSELKNFGITVTGDKQIDDNLRFLTRRLQRQLVKKATNVAAKTVVIPDAMRRAPKDAGDLAASLHARDLLGDEVIRPPTKTAPSTRARNVGFGTQVIAGRGFADENGDFFYGAAAELGTPKTRPRYPKQSFLRPALYKNAIYIRAIFILALRRFIKGVK